MQRRTVTKTLCCALFATLIASTSAFARQDKQSRPSPPEQATVSLGGHTVTIDYSAPSMRGRKIFGGLVPYDKEWRTGANEATTIKSDVNLRIGNLGVPAGTHTLYSIPGENGWTLIVNNQTGQWGTVYDQLKDLGRVKMSEGAMPSSPVETFQIKFEDTKDLSTELHLQWETTNVYVQVTAVP
ncbi:DUF2911 domain-containing protein [Alloacidobacterium sp.]|uniref:DUF2911 domain-containing protein n=1 Tax=Alloacidobacterium sp. TaxID=2951999 RepID=UPI002D418FDA|nr:DUF2911 domain-containing protein [Alloacidobacterium sp.]HYK37064.1 DUF2911 domain-containing protein [Alloacidobacterium sp.]